MNNFQNNNFGNRQYHNDIPKVNNNYTQVPNVNMNANNNFMPNNNQNRIFVRTAIVKSENDISPFEIPSDGSMALFMQEDQQVIYGKAINVFGTPDTVKFVRVADDQETINSISASYNDINQRLDKIEKMLTKQYSNNKKKPYVKKEVKNHE